MIKPLVQMLNQIFTHYTSIFPPPSRSGGTSSTTGAALLAPLTPTPCCFSKANRKNSSTIKKAPGTYTNIFAGYELHVPATFPLPSSATEGTEPEGQESKLDLNECVS